MHEALLMIRKLADRSAERPLLTLSIAVLALVGLMLAPFPLIGLRMNTPFALLMHIFTFSVLAFFLVSLRLIRLDMAIMVLILLAVGLELIQVFSSSRNVGLKDIVANLSGVMLGLCAALFWLHKGKTHRDE